ncbi:hypothetical protein N7475_002567 [Penicillium sp. IBT 31633x]|nr:hypothetical protein N7475_002567 [Penicillium sp. IBT 31633x]
MTDLLLAEQALREQTQREEALHHRSKALRKVIAITSDNTELQEVNKELEGAESQYRRKAHALYRAESMLPSSIKSLYDTIVRTEADVAAGNVDAAHRDIYPKDRKAEGTALLNAGAVSAFADLIFQRKKRRRSEKG